MIEGGKTVKTRSRRKKLGQKDVLLPQIDLSPTQPLSNPTECVPCGGGNSNVPTAQQERPDAQTQESKRGGFRDAGDTDITEDR
jgi:hypothetical protein